MQHDTMTRLPFSSHRRMRVRAGVFVTCTLALLAGCSTTRLIDSDVQTFSSVTAIGRGAPYRFERLPSQQAHSVQQSQLEAIAEPALAQVGLTHDDSTARYSVQVALQVNREVTIDPWGGGWGPGWGPGWGGPYYRGPWRGGFGGWGPGPYGFPDRTLYRQEVSVLLRELATHKVVYETHATYDDIRPADAAVLRTMFDSALQGFPKAPPGIRRIDVEIPR
jgi:hypothetical protein